MFADGTGRYRIEDTYNVGRGDEGWAVTLGGIDRVLRSEGQGPGPAPWTVVTRASPTPWPLRLPEVCDTGWSHVGVDLVLDRPADHVRCASDTSDPDYWIDRETHLVVRKQGVTDERYGTWISAVTGLEFGPQPDELFQLPPGAEVQP